MFKVILKKKQYFLKIICKNVAGAIIVHWRCLALQHHHINMLANGIE